MEYVLVGVVVVTLPLIAVLLVILAALDWKRFQYDRQRHDEAILERQRRREEREIEKAVRRQENAANRLFNAASGATTQSRFSLEGKKLEAMRATWKGGWDGVEVHLPSLGQWGTSVASAFVRCTSKGDEIVVNLVGHRNPLKYSDISHLDVAAAALAAVISNYPHRQ